MAATPDDDETDLAAWRAFGAGLLRPARPRLAEALCVVTGIALEQVREALAAPAWRWERAHGRDELVWGAEARRDGAVEDVAGRAASPRGGGRLTHPRAAWEALAARGVIPADWIGDRARAFYDGGDAPPTVEAAVALASDPEGVVTAEALARETARRLAPWLARGAPTRVRWRMLDSFDTDSNEWTDMAAYGPGGEPVGEVMHAAAQAAERIGYRKPMLTLRGRVVLAGAQRRVAPDLAEGVGALVSAQQYYRAAAAARVASDPVRLAFARHPDPFEPLLAVWARGYALWDVGRSVVTLVAPPVNPLAG